MDQKSNISTIIKNKIESISEFGSRYDSGVVISLSDGIATVYGLQSAFSGEIVEFENKAKGLVITLNSDHILVCLLDSQQGIKEGSKVIRTKKILQVPVGMELLGRVVDPLGNPLDEYGDIETNQTRNVFSEAPGIIARQSVHEPLHTGIKSIDLLIPIGKGQRELIIGDRGSGKSSIALSTILNQKQFHDSGSDKEKVYCVYVAIGQRRSFISKFVKQLKENNALQYSIIVAASASDPATMQYIAPYSGCAIAEYFRDNGMHSLAIYDDLSKHAVAYRELTLLLRRPPGREAYPGDVFYLHSKLLERGAKMSQDRKGGSLTSLPIIETQDGDISTYIPTNVISITDGQIFLDKGLFNSGNRPAVDVGLSVSRVGSAAQNKITKSVAGSLKLEISTFLELQAFSKLSSDIDHKTKEILNRGERIFEILKQDTNEIYKYSEQFLSIFLLNNGYLNNIELNEINSKIREFLKKSAQLIDQIESVEKIDDSMKDKIIKAIESSVLFKK